MYARWKRSARKKGPEVLYAVLVESVRRGGKPRQRFVAHLGSVPVDALMTSGARQAFWAQVRGVLEALELDQNERADLEEQLARVVPRARVRSRGDVRPAGRPPASFKHLIEPVRWFGNAIRSSLDGSPLVTSEEMAAAMAALKQAALPRYELLRWWMEPRWMRAKDQRQMARHLGTSERGVHRQVDRAVASLYAFLPVETRERVERAVAAGATLVAPSSYAKDDWRECFSRPRHDALDRWVESQFER